VPPLSRTAGSAAAAAPAGTSDLPRVENPGGSALLGGVMMRCGTSVGMAARRPDGTIATAQFDIPAPAARWIDRVPVVRGMSAVAASLNASLPALAWSFKVRFPHLPVPDVVRLRRGAVVSLLVLDAVFSAVPAMLSSGAGTAGFGSLALETAVRVALLLGYLAAVRLHPDVRELFAYHGSEHKTVAAYEAGAPLTVESVRPRSLRHVRCGTAFILWLVVAASLATPLVHDLPLAIGIAARFAVMALAAGVAYEVLRAGARWDRYRPVRWLLEPGLALQRLTTTEPTDAQMEVGIAAFEAALHGAPAPRAEADRRAAGPAVPTQRQAATQTGAPAPV
jgi:uncharacterized protein YqhQ